MEPPPGRDRVNAHHRRAHADPGHLGFEGALVFAVVVRHVGGGAAHVETDHPADPGHLGGAHHADHAAGGTGEDAVLALEQPGVGEAAVGLHEHQPDAAQFSGDPVHVTAQDGRQIGVHHGGVAARDQLHQRADLVGGGHLGEAHLAGDGGHPALVVVEPVAVHEDDGHGSDAGVERVAQGRARRLFVERGEDLALGVHALVDLHHPLVEQFRQDDVAVEQPGPVLIADAQRVGETPGDRQHHAVALALQQGVGGDRRSHFDRMDPVGGDRLARLEPEGLANALDGRVPVALGILRQQLARDLASVRPLGHHVGERSAAIDPELPPRLVREERHPTPPSVIAFL